MVCSDVRTKRPTKGCGGSAVAMFLTATSSFAVWPSASSVCGKRSARLSRTAEAREPVEAVWRESTAAAA